MAGRALFMTVRAFYSGIFDGGSNKKGRAQPITLP
jgi:hypothetical protein